MLQFWGNLKEKMGKPVHKAVLMRFLGMTDRKMPSKDPWGNPVQPSLNKSKPIKLYERVASHYWTIDELWWNYRKKQAYELHPENESQKIGETTLSYINYDSGNPIAMDETVQVVHPPKILSRMLKVDHVEGAVRASLGGASGWVIPLMAFGLGAAIFFMLGMNFNGIAGAITGASPTPPPFGVSP